MRTYPFRWVYLPYVLKRQGDGRYAVLNRRYEPLANMGTARLDISADLAGELSCDGSRALDEIHLYNDGCLPESSDEAWLDYSLRLKLLMRSLAEFE